jgi:hypothetical protein
MISTINQFTKSLKMRYYDALKLSVTLFSDKAMKEPTQQPLQLVKLDDDEYEFTNLKSKPRGK